MVPLCVKLCAEEPLKDNNTPPVLPSILPAFVTLPVMIMLNNVVLPIILPDAPRLKVVVLKVEAALVVTDPLFIVNPPLNVTVPPAAKSLPPLIKAAPVIGVVGAVPKLKPPVPVLCNVKVPLTVVKVFEKVAVARV